MSIKLSRQHGVAPALMFCRICGKETNGIALLGAEADKVMKDLHEQTNGQHGSADGYKEYGHNRIPDANPCEECQGYLDQGGTILIAKDTGEYLRLDKGMVDNLVGKIVTSKGAVDFEAMRGKICRLDKAFWYADGDGNVRLRDPKEWS